MRRSVLATGAALAALVAAHGASAQEAPFTQMVVFGDSLSDTGNVATLNGMTELNSYTTNPGPVTVEVVADAYGLTVAPSLKGGTNSAYGGAGFLNNSFGTPASIPTLTAQVASYLAANPGGLDPNAFYTVFGGGNDVNFAATNLVLGLQTLPAATANMTAAGNQAVSVINSLQAAGAKTIIVVNVPDVGLTPSARGADAISPGSSARITGLSQTFNTALNVGLAGKRGVVPVNAFLFLQETVANKEAFGLVDVTGTACTTSSSLTCTTSTLKAPGADQTWLFADGIHPTTAGHVTLGDLIVSELAAPQQISLLGEQPLGILAAGRTAIGAELANAEGGARLFGTLSYATQDYDAQNAIQASDASGGIVTLGGLWPMNERLTLGAALTVAQTETDFGAASGGFETAAQVVSVFLSAPVGEGGYVSAQADVGRLTFDDIERTLHLGANVRTEKGETDGRTKGASVSGGYWFGAGGLRHGPVASMTYGEVRVDAYREADARSSSMTFGDQKRESIVYEAGWAIQGETQMSGAALTPFAQVTYAVESEDDARLVDAGLVTMNGTFSMPGFTPNEDWIAVKAGTGIELGDRAALRAVYSGRFGDVQDDHAVSVGVNLRY